MTLSQILEQRKSVRAFIDKPVDPSLLSKVFSMAQLAPSNCNVQPCIPYVVSGEMKDKVKAALMADVMSGNKPSPEFNWLPKYQGIHRERQFGSANALYSSMDIAREDKQARQMAMVRNWSFFDAPHAVFFTMDKYLDIMGAVDLGIYAQTLSLIMEEHGISSCMQGALGQFPNSVKELLDIPEDAGILFGMSFGYADDQAAVNTTKTDRESIESAVAFFD